LDLRLQTLSNLHKQLITFFKPIQTCDILLVACVGAKLINADSEKTILVQAKFLVQSAEKLQQR